MADIRIPRGSIEYVKTPVTADVSLTMTVAISIRANGAAHTWLAAEWTGTAGTTRTARTTTEVTFSTANYPLNTYTVYVKLTDTPEAPIIEAGKITITA